MEKELKNAIHTDLIKKGTTNYEIIVSCGKDFRELAMAGVEMPADRKIAISGDLSTEELIAFVEQLTYSTYEKKQDRAVTMAESLGNAFVFDGDSQELLCGVELNFEGYEVKETIHSTTLEPELGQPVNVSETPGMHR